MMNKGAATLLAAFLLTGPASFVSVQAFAGETEGIDGTLPLRLPADGTLPLRLAGMATAMSGTLPAVTTEIIITQAVRTSLSAAAGAILSCQQPEDQISKHTAAGSVKVGSSTYVIKGICYNHTNKNMEVVAERSVNAATVERSFMIGLLPAEQPQQFQGRLQISGSAGQTDRYAFSTQRLGGIFAPE